MEGNEGFYFIQVTDAHIAPMDVEGNATLELHAVPHGSEIIPARDREHLVGLTPDHLREAVVEITALDPQPAFVLFTGDQTTCGTRAEWERFLEITAPLRMSRYYNTSNHDLGATPEVFEELVGPRRAILDCAGLRFFVMDEYQRCDEGGAHLWRTQALPEHTDWIREGLAGQTATAAVLVIHAPILPVGGGAYAEHWNRAGTGAFVDFLADQGFRWIITGHWHRNMTWDLAGMTVISTGALSGFQCSGPEPFFLFPVRPGYRMFHWDGEVLRSVWRNLRAWIETGIAFIGGEHTHGPRPQVRPVTIGGPADVHVQAYAPGGRIEAVELGLAMNAPRTKYSTAPVMHASGWQPMKRTWEGLWSEWETSLDPRSVSAGDYVCLSRARREGDDDWFGHDAAPVRISSDRDAPASAGAERLFALFDKPTDGHTG